MKKINKVKLVVYFFALFNLLFEMRAYAYIDPATTSYLVQIVAGVLIAGGATIGVFGKRIKLYFKEQKIKNLEKKLTKEAEKRNKSEK